MGRGEDAVRGRRVTVGEQLIDAGKPPALPEDSDWFDLCSSRRHWRIRAWIPSPSRGEGVERFAALGGSWGYSAFEALT